MNAKIITYDMPLKVYRLLAESIIMTSSSTTQTAIETLKHLNIEQETKNLINLRNYNPSTFDIVVALLLGKNPNPNMILLGYIYGYGNCRVKTSNISRTSGTRSIGLNSNREVSIATTQLGITPDITLGEALEHISKISYYETNTPDFILELKEQKKFDLMECARNLLCIYQRN